MNEQCARFVERVRRQWPTHFGGTVLEFGSRAVNGSSREFFEGCLRYIGVDCIDGPNVDAVALAHEWVPPEGVVVDLAASLNSLEHDPHWGKTVDAMVERCRPGGLVLIFCAGKGYPEHGTKKAPRAAGLYGPEADYYLNLLPEYFLSRWADRFSRFEAGQMPSIRADGGPGIGHFTTFWGIKAKR